MKLAITCGYNNSKHCVSLLSRLKNQGIKVSKILIVKTFSRKRLMAYYRQLDLAELKKKFIDRILSKYLPKTKISDEMAYIDEFMKENNIPEISVSQWCKNNSTKFCFVESLNSQKSLKFIDGVDYVVYAGGGIVGQKFLDTVTKGVLNCHAGKLPEIRGMNASEWSILLDIPLYNTLHFMVRKIDLGPIIELIPHDYSDCKTINQIRGKAIVYSIQDLVHGIKLILSEKYQQTQQTESAGLQYYVMHPALKSLVNQKLLAK
jgi:folate-dependent phosphoribosylglycinamide formyltransferase PurN